MAEIKGTIHIKAGQIDRLENLPHEEEESDLSAILRKLTVEGWTLAGDYTLELTSTQETNEERMSELESVSKSIPRLDSRVVSEKPNK